MSWKAEVIADSSGKFCGNGLRFATRREAETYARDLANRWTLVSEWRVVESDDAVNEPTRFTRQEDTRNANHVDGLDRDDLGESPDY
jgi:hypothetical protein